MRFKASQIQKLMSKNAQVFDMIIYKIKGKGYDEEVRGDGIRRFDVTRCSNNLYMCE